jgi:hypothetical protein
MKGMSNSGHCWDSVQSLQCRHVYTCRHVYARRQLHYVRFLLSHYKSVAGLLTHSCLCSATLWAAHSFTPPARRSGRYASTKPAVLALQHLQEHGGVLTTTCWTTALDTATHQAASGCQPHAVSACGCILMMPPAAEVEGQVRYQWLLTFPLLEAFDALCHSTAKCS